MALHDMILTDGVRLVPTDVATRGLNASASDYIRVQPTIIPYYGQVVTESLRLRELHTTQHIANVTVEDALRILDDMLRATPAALVDTFGVEGVLQVQSAIRMVERMGLSDALKGSGAYNLTLVQAMRLTARVLRFWGAEIEEGLGLDDNALARVLAIAGVEETIGVEAVVAPQLLLNVLLRDGMAITAELALRALFNPTLIEGVEINAGFVSEQGDFTTWAMNTRTGAVTEYADFVFNSFARVGNRYFGASSEGLYELVGDTDDDDDIVARIAGGYLQFGGTRLSRLKSAYIAMTGEGDTILKIIEKGGNEYVYRVGTRDGRSTKVHMGKGQRARYFAFELTTVGQDFDLDTLEFVPIVVQRRV